MTDTAESTHIANTLDRLRTIRDLGRSRSFLLMLQGDIDEFEALIGSAASREEQRSAFHRVMALAFCSSASWERLHALSVELGIPSSIMGGYALRTAMPHPMIVSELMTSLRELLVKEQEEIKKALAPLEEAERLERERAQAEWDALRERVETVVPGTHYNCQVRYEETVQDDDIGLGFRFCYPCRGIYELSGIGAHVCSACDAEGKAQSHAHGRVILSSEDGLMLLPHIVRTQADLLQVVDDLRAKGTFLQSGDPTWYETCRVHLSSHPVVAALPPGDPAESQPRDLTQERLFWQM